MSEINTIEWLYKPTPERIKQINKVKNILSKITYLTAIPYAIVGYIQYMNDKENGMTFIIILAIVYIVGIILWKLVVSKQITPKEKSYTLNNNGIKILEISTNKLIEYTWDKFESFSKEVNPLNKQEVGILLPLKEKKDNRTNYVFLDLNYNSLEKIVNTLNKKLVETNKKEEINS